MAETARKSDDMGSQPLITAIITTHNRVGLLANAIQSVKMQDYGRVEIIVVDDASDDGTAEYLQGLDGIKTILIPKAESGGGNHARNIGLLEASGEYVAFLDDDDEWMPSKTRLQIEKIVEHPECMVAGCGRLFVDDDGQEWVGDELPQGDLSELIMCCIPFSTSTLMASKQLLMDVGGFDEELSHWQEYELEMRLFQRSSVVCVNKPLVRYRVSSSDTARLSNNLDRWEQSVAIIESKHRDLIASSALRTRKLRQQMICLDGAKRAYALGNHAECRSYLLRAFLSRPSFKGFAKLAIGRPSKRII